eukprot:880566-Rhodomonas_salina.1
MRIADRKRGERHEEERKRAEKKREDERERRERALEDELQREEELRARAQVRAPPFCLRLRHVVRLILARVAAICSGLMICLRNARC